MSLYKLQGIASDVTEKICACLHKSHKVEAIKLYASHINCGFEEAGKVIDNLEVEMIKNKEFPDRSPEKDLALCGVCKNVKLRRGGLFFHGGDEWLYLRLFVCTECMTALAMQRTFHELCYECREHLPDGYCEPSLIEDLGDMVSRFEKAHANIFNKLPPSTDERYEYPGSLSADLDHWLKEHKPE